MSDKKKNNSRTALVITICIMLLAGLAVQQNWFSGLFRPDQLPGPPEPTPVVTVEKTSPEEPEPTGLLPAEAEIPAADEQQTAEEAVEALPSCETTTGALLAFFKHLDQQEYIKAYQIKGTTVQHLNGLAHKLFANPPFVTNETADLVNILKNMTHIFRTIGKQDITLLKDILGQEKDIIETVLLHLYQWHLLEQSCRANGTYKPEDASLLDLPVDGLYEYASFFLNTLGGQSYLLRRQPRLRVLVKYYSVLILDRANTEFMNRHGVDIRYPVNVLIDEIESVRGLLYSEKYLLKLYELQEKYRLQLPAND